MRQSVKTEPRPRVSVGGWKTTIMTPLAQAGERFRPAVCPLTKLVGQMEMAALRRQHPPTLSRALNRENPALMAVLRRDLCPESR
jgi:hypothetical protein